ncbi:MAG: hypothetical protein LBS57_10960 [Treponema sp.]|nr:hypothetical protein [Treponema sp.]
MITQCPGSADKQVVCGCGFVAYNDVQNCISWCRYARECVGEELYKHYKGGK